MNYFLQTKSELCVFVTFCQLKHNALNKLHPTKFPRTINKYFPIRRETLEYVSQAKI